MLVKKTSEIPSSEMTDKKLYLRRREFIQAAAVTLAGAAAGTFAPSKAEAAPSWPRVKIPNVQKAASPALTTTEKPNSYQDITTYNNFYEFGIDKDAPSDNARNFKTDNWTVTVDGECAKKAAWHVEDILKGAALEERIPEFDLVITTAAIPGRPAPRLIPAAAAEKMRPGSTCERPSAPTTRPPDLSGTPATAWNTP